MTSNKHFGAFDAAEKREDDEHLHRPQDGAVIYEGEGADLENGVFLLSSPLHTEA